MMATQEDVAKALTGLFSLRQPFPEYRYGLTGQGTGAANSDVSSRPGWAHIRYDDNQSRVSQVFNPRYPGIPENVPVIVGKERHNDRFVQILRINWEIYFERLTIDMLQQYIVPNHGYTHNAVSGGDPAYLDTRNLLPGRVRQTDTPTMSVYAEGLYYSSASAMAYFPGGTANLAAFVPVAADTHRYVLVSIDPDTNALTSLAGGVFSMATTPSPPAVPVNNVPLALVLLTDTTTAIAESDITDYRVIFSSVAQEAEQQVFVNEIAYLAEAVYAELDLLHDLVQDALWAVMDAEEHLDQELTTHIVP